MLPELYKIGPFTVYSYGLMLVIAFSVASLLASRQAAKEGISPELIVNLFFIAFLSGVIGARLFYVVYNFPEYAKHPIEIIKLQHGGLSWFGGLILGTTCSVLYLRNKKLKVFRILDLIVPFLALAQAIGRIGCLLNGCCFGKESVEFGIYCRLQDAYLIPTQIYSSLLLLLIFIVLRIFQERPHKTGEIFYLYLLLYSMKRFFIEFWRADNPQVAFGLTLFQVLSILVFVISLAGLASVRSRKVKG